MASIFGAQSIEKLNGNNFHMWKMKMKFLLCEKYLWEITLGELLPLEVEFGKIIFEGSNFEYCLIIKKDKLVH
jgi:hypothetical protein